MTDNFAGILKRMAGPSELYGRFTLALGGTNIASKMNFCNVYILYTLRHLVIISPQIHFYFVVNQPP